MKKKSPPYAIIGAVILGIVGIAIAVKWKNAQDAKAAADKAAALQDVQNQLAAAKANQVTVASTPTNMRNVLYATQPVDPGIRVSAAFFEKKPTPTDILPDAYSDKDDVVGWYAIRRIEKGDPLTPRNINKAPAYMSQRITPGMRAIALPVFNAEVNDTGGFIVDGDKVDLLWTTLSQDGSLRYDTQFLMQNVSVLFVPGPTIKTEKTDGITPVPPPGDAVSVTFEVTPEQAQALIYLQNAKNGHFSMILRSRKDTAELKIKPFTGEDYLSNLKKVQSMSDKAQERVNELTKQIEAAEKTNGNTNETPTPTPPSP